MPTANSVSRWVAGLESPDLRVRDEAARRIWRRFARELHRVVRRRLNARVRIREDEDDIVQSTFAAYFEAQSKRRYPLSEPGELARLLRSIARRKTTNTTLRHTAGCRNVRREQSLTIPDPEDEASPERRAEFEDSRAIGPDEEALGNIEVARILGLLPADLRPIVRWRLEGFTEAEIAQRLNRTTRTVEIKLNRIRKVLIQDPGICAQLNGTRRTRGPGFTRQESARNRLAAP
jgi:RNA polymerase sigma factor (sigma-70 family)